MPDWKTNAAECAFPYPLEASGLTKREHFAISILAGLEANPDRAEMPLWDAARRAVNLADVLLQHLAETEQCDEEGE